MLNETVPGVRASAEVTAASVDNLKLIRDNKADIAFTLADTLADAVAARGAFAGGPPVPVASLAVLYSNYTQIVALEEFRHRRSIADLRGKVISTGSPGSGTEVIALRLLEAAGLDPDRDVQPAGARRDRVGRRAEGRQDRRVLLERRPAERGHSGSLAHARHPHRAAAERGPAARASAGVRRRSTFRSRFRRRPTRASTRAVPVVASRTCWW